MLVIFGVLGQLASGYDFKKEFDSERMKGFAAQESWTEGEAFRMADLLLHAGILKDRSFEALIEEKELRKYRCVDLALAAYDFQLNGSKEALNLILAQLATERVGADVDTIIVLSTLNEWDRTVRAFRKHFVFTDGTGGSCKHAFMGTRKLLYPIQYGQYRKVIEAPIKWNIPLVPKKK